MNQQINPAKEYLERQVQNASPAERVVLAYDGAIRFLLAARRAIEENNIEARYLNNKKAADLITYLMDTLDMEKGGEIAENLQRLYFYMLRRLMEVDVKNSVEPLDEVVNQLKKLRMSWEQLARGEGGGAASTETEASPPPPGRVSATA